MKAKSFFWLCMLLLATATVSFTFSSCNGDEPTVVDPDDGEGEGEGGTDNPGGDDGDEPVPTMTLPDSILNGSDFYCIFLGESEEATLGDKVKEPTMLRDYDVWPGGETLAAKDRLGVNAFGAPEAWIAFDHAGSLGWNGGAIVAILSQFEEAPDLSVLDESFTFHFAIKSPNNQKNAGLTLFFYSEGTEVKYYFGPEASAPDDQIYKGDYVHDGEWQHFEIPVADLMNDGYLWTGPMTADNDRAYVLGFQGNPHTVGTEINLDALFFYKKPAK